MLLLCSCNLIGQEKNYLSRPSLITEAFCKQGFLWLVAEEEFGEIRSMQEIQQRKGSVLLLRWRESKGTDHWEAALRVLLDHSP